VLTAHVRSIRRGYQVYREVCAACHSLDRIAWRNVSACSSALCDAAAEHARSLSVSRTLSTR